MLTEEQSKIVKLVYNKFIESEDESSWGELDNTLEYVGWLGDPELVTESKVRFEEHHVGVFRCAQDHGNNGAKRVFCASDSRGGWLHLIALR